MLVVSGCFHAEEKKPQEGPSAELKIETTSPELLDEVAKIQATGNTKNCKKLEQENLQKQCELTIKAEQENAKLRAKAAATSTTSQP